MCFRRRKAVQREREKLHEMTSSRQCFKPIPRLMEELNRHLRGWTNYFCFGYPTSVFCELDRYLAGRLIQHLQRRSQRPYRPPKSVGWYAHLRRLGLRHLSELVHASGDSFQESRTREIRISGSTRGEWAALLHCPLSYSTGS